MMGEDEELAIFGLFGIDRIESSMGMVVGGFAFWFLRLVLGLAGCLDLLRGSAVILAVLLLRLCDA
jgi:hypothetical protein